MQFFSSEEKSLFLKNFVNLAFVKGISKLLPLFITGYTISTLGMFEFGKLGFARAIAFYFTTLIAYGFDYTGAQQIVQAYAQNHKTKLNYIFTNILSSQIITIILCFFLYFGLVDCFPAIAEVKMELLYFFGVSIFSALFPIYVFHGINQIWIVSLLSLLSKVAICALIPFFVKTPDDKLTFIFIHVAVDCVRLLIAYLILFVNFKVRLTVPNILEVFEQFRNGFSFFVYKCYLLFVSKFSIVFLGFVIHDAVMIGIFSLCNQIFGVLKEIYNVAIQALYPIVSTKFTSRDNAQGFLFNYLFVVICPMIIIFSLLNYFFAPYILSLFITENLALNVSLLRVFTIVFAVGALNEFLGTNILIPMRKSVAFVLMMIGCIVLSVFFHMYFVNEYGILGGGYAIFCQEASLLLLQIVFFLLYQLF